MELQPVLRGPTVTIRPLTQADRAALIEAGRDPEIWAQHPDKDRHRPERIAAYVDDAIASGTAFAIEEVATGRMIGTSRYAGLDVEAGRIEIGWTFLVRDHWGGRTNREVKRLMLDHAFGLVPVVQFRIGADNRRSRRAVEKLGARYVGPEAGGEKGRVIYEIDRATFRR